MLPKEDVQETDWNNPVGVSSEYVHECVCVCAQVYLKQRRIVGVEGDDEKVCQYRDMQVKRSRQEDKEIGTYKVRSQTKVKVVDKYDDVRQTG